MLIVLSGKARSGKDTAAQMLNDTLPNSKCIAYADYLKEIIGSCFGLTWDQLHGDSKEAAIEGLPIRTKSGHITTHCWTPRKLLQYLGTDVFRTIDPDCWLNVVKSQVALGYFDNYIIKDSRFPNEIDWVLASGGINIRIERQDKDFVSGTDHASETSLDEHIEREKSYVVYNNKDLGYLNSQLLNIINTRRNKPWQLKSSV